MPYPLKNNAKAVQCRQEGNQLFREKQYDDAMTKYNESICWAETNSEHIGIAYGNRSAVLYEQEQYEFALTYIALAKRHNYPERLMPKLEARERSCHRFMEQKLRRGDPEPMAELFPKLALNVEVNPRIPYIAKGMHVQEDPDCGTVMVADRDFKVGDVILIEKSLVGSLNPTDQYRFCDYCLNCMVCGLVPCRYCVSTVYCNEQCREKGWDTFHRFECEIRQELHETVLSTGCAYTGIRMFLYGVNLFKDDVGKMMKCRKAYPRTGSDPMKLDFVNYNPMEEFKTISTAKHCEALASKFPVEEMAARFCQIYRKSTMIQILFNSNAKREFMHQSFIDHLKAFPYRYQGSTANDFYTIASNFNVRRYKGANLTRLSVNGFVKLVVHRAVKKGDQLTMQQNGDMTDYDCKCGTVICMNQVPSRDFATLLQVLENPRVDFLGKMNTHQQFIQAYCHSYYNQCFFKKIVRIYHNLLGEVFMQELRVTLRAKAFAELSSP